jgi:gliding motility-associated-like protein
VPYTNPLTGFTYTTPVCITSTANPSPSPGFTTGGVFSYTGAVGSTLNLNTSTGEITLAGINAGTYVITYSYPINLVNCINPGSSTFTITIDPFVTATFTQIPSICQNTTAPVLPILSNNNILGTWNAAISTATPGNTTYTFTPNLGQCGVGTNMNITIDPILVPTFNAIATICQNEVAPSLPTLSNNTIPISGTWSPTVINTGIAGPSNYVFTPSTGQCSQAVTKTVIIEPRLTPAFAQIQPLCVGDASVTLPLNSTNSVSGTWSPAVVNTNSESNLVYTFTPDTSECASVVTMSVLVEQCQIQKGISPNGDGLNDFLELVAKKVEIFNRYGKEVYSKENYNNDWHGQFMGGGEMPDGTYYYVIELVSGENKTGWIYINREQK